MRRWAAGVGAFGLAAALAGCDSLLGVENPGVIDEQDLDDPSFVQAMVNAVINEFQTQYSFQAFAGAIFTDEALNGHNFTQWRDIDLRLIEDDNSQLLEIYRDMQTARAVADDMIGRLRDLLESPGNSVGMATALAYGGYALTRLGEYFCYSPIEANGAAVRSEGILAAALERFDEAIQVGQAAGGQDGTRIVNLARVGAARAALQRGDFNRATSYASQVPAGFAVHIRHVATPTTHRNYIFGATTGTNRTIGVDPSFRDLNDRRVRHTANWVTGHNQTTRLYTPAMSPAFVGWDPTVPMNLSDTELINRLGIGMDTGMLLASHLEARYILAEAGGMNDTELRAFIDERRAVGGQTPFTGSDLKAELRDQRRRDFFLSGHRLGDLRRYIALYGVDYFPSGPHPNDAAAGWGPYMDATCFVPHRNEGVSNPNYEPLD